MQVNSGKIIADIKVISTNPFYDFRGEFLETFNKETYNFTDIAGGKIEFVEDDISVSRQHVLHGLHGDDKTHKLIQCLHGEVFFVIVDMRKESSTYLKHETFLLSDKNRLQVLVPAGCANGHLCLTEKCIFSYKQSQYYSSHKNQFSVRWDDPSLNIFWPISNPILSQRDAKANFINA
jgi:dTDP-4-dehydrorhamnose 3,5-epimerase